MKKMKVVIVDDESASRSVLVNYLTKYCDGLDVCGEADSVASALKLVPTVKPDLLFLDVEMPGGNGFDLIDQLEDVSFHIVFVTAFDHYAIKALNYGAAYYLLKPLSIDDLLDAVHKIKNDDSKWLAEQNRITAEHARGAASNSDRIVLPLMDGFEVVSRMDIVYCSAHDNFTDVILRDGKKKMICRTLKFYEELLEHDGFLRVHKSHLINMKHVSKYSRSGGGVIVMTNGAEIPLSPQKKDLFLSFFESGR